MKRAYELLALFEATPMLALGIALMSEQDFLNVSLKAKRMLVARACKDGLVSQEEFERTL